MQKNRKKIISFIILVSFMISGGTSLAKTNQNKTTSKIIYSTFSFNYQKNLENKKIKTFNQNDVFVNKNKTLSKNTPTLPTIISATAIPGVTSAILNGVVNPNGQSTNAWFRVPLSAPLGMGNIGNGTSPVEIHPYTLTGLTPDTTYTFLVAASNAHGTTEGSWITFRTLGINNNDIPPTIISSTVVPSTTSAILNGVVNPNGQSTSAWFEIFSLGTPNKLGLQKIGFGNSPITLNPYKLEKLTPNTTYQFRIIANNESGITIGNWITFKTLENTNSELTLRSINPDNGKQGETLDINLIGTGFTSDNIADDLEVIFSGSGIDINSIIVNSATSAKINIDIASNASIGERTVTIKNSNGTSNAKTFTIVENNNGGGGGGGGSSGSYVKRYVKVTTQNATNILKNSATLNGSINPNNHTTTVWFEYGTGSNLSTFNETSHLSFGSFNYYSTLTQSITNLTPGTTYYFRAVGNNYAGTIRGNIFSFTTMNDTTPVIPENNNNNPTIINPDPIIDDYQINNEEQMSSDYDFLDNRNLAANPLFGFTKFLPSSFWSWLLFLVMTFLIIFLGRKLYQDYSLDKAMKKVNADHINNLPL